MSSTQQGSSSNGGRSLKAVKGEKGIRRSWSPREEVSLLTALKELVAHGWKSDNGFRSGYLTKLEDDITRDLPGTDIRGQPHINSKIQIWKKHYYSLTLMLSQSGVGWNSDGKHTIDCEDDQWEQIKKCDRNAKGMRHRPWPMFEDWQYVFGQHRTTGDNAEDMLDAVNKMVQEEIRAESGQPFDENEVCMEDISVNDVGDDSSSQFVKSKVVNKTVETGKKRKSNVDGLQAAVELFCEISRGTNERLQMVANRVGYEYDVDQAKRDAYALVENMSGFSLEQKFEVTDIFTGQRNRLITFQGLSDDAMEKYVQHLLRLKK